MEIHVVNPNRELKPRLNNMPKNYPSTQIRIPEKQLHFTDSIFQLQVSEMVCDPDATVVALRFGSLSHVH